MSEDQETKENMLTDTKLYLKSGIHIGTKFRTKYMAKFIYKTRPDGLSMLNLQNHPTSNHFSAKNSGP